MDQSNIAEILSAPKVITKSGTKALIRMVEEQFFPINWKKPTISTPSTSGSDITQTSTVQINQSVPEFGEATDYGIRLEVTPTVSPNNYTILLELKPQRSDFIGWTNYQYKIETWAGAITPTTVTTQYTQPVKMAEMSIRDVTTKVMVYDGTTTVLGGMIKDDTTSYDDIIPILGEFPLVGRFFRSEFKSSVKKNLLIFVTARLVKPDGTPFRDTPDNSLFDFGQY